MLLQIRQWSPFAQSGFSVIFEENAALVWCWDQVQVQHGRTKLPRKWHEAELIPESALFKPGLEGCYLMKCSDGVEAQYWCVGELYASRWWPQAPDLAEFKEFCRDVGLGLHQVSRLPPIIEPERLKQTWLPIKSAAELSDAKPTWEKILYFAMLLSLILIYGWYSMREQQLGVALQQIKMQMSMLTNQTGGIGQARDLANQAVEEILERQSLNPYPTQLELLSAVAEALPADTTLREWEFQDNKLRIVITIGKEAPSRTDIAKILLQTGYFANLQNLLTKDSLSLAFRMEVLAVRGKAMQNIQPSAVQGGK